MSHLPNQCDLLIHNVHLATMNPKASTSEDSRYGTVYDGAILVDAGKIIWLGKQHELPKSVNACRIIDGQQQWLTPGLIDCHTHLVYAGDRSDEFELRQEGVSYETIAKTGGGILSTVNATRAASEDELVQHSRSRLEALLKEGVTTVEIKSGYGLDTETELKILRAAGRLAQEYPATVVRTFLGAHCTPPEYQGCPDDYIKHICNDMLPAIAKEQLADAIDVFCENIAFTPHQTEQVFKAAHALGLPVKLHAEQLSDSGGTTLAVRYRALSVDHLEYLSEEGLEALANSDTVATLLPGAFYCLRETQLPPIEALRSKGVPMAIATDLNPGTSPIASIRMMMHLACTLFKLTPAEALAGCTRHAAKALGLNHSVGMLQVGMTADMVLWPITTPAALAANQTGADPTLVLHNGEIVRKSTVTQTPCPEAQPIESIWSGRVDQEEDPELSQRWHQQIKVFNPEHSTTGVAFIGFGSDEGVRRNKGRQGAAKGPDLIRKAIAPLPWNRKDPAWDAGTVFCEDQKLENAQNRYAQLLTRMLDQGVLPIGLGGGHEIAWGSYQGLIHHLENTKDDSQTINVGIINFDAHFDLRLPDNGASSGTPFWQIAEYTKTKGHAYHYLCLGVSHSSNTAALFKRAQSLGVTYLTDQQMTTPDLTTLLETVRSYIDSVDHIYLTIDLDAFPAAVVPGVSAPAARGISLEVVEPLLQIIKDSGKMRLFDIAEFNPRFDIDNRSARVAARLIYLLTSEQPD